MNLFQDILSKIKKDLDAKSLDISLVSKIISDIVGVEISKDKIKQKGSHIFLNISPTLKSKLILKRQDIISAFQKNNLNIKSFS